MAQFRSPFSLSRGYELKLTRVDPSWPGVKQAYTWATERDAEILWLVQSCQVLTRSQVAKLFWPGSPQTGEKRLNRMARMGVLVPHTLTSSAAAITFYTLGPVGCQVLKAPYVPNWWMDLDLSAVLKMLVVAQLYLRFYRIAKEAVVFPAPAPFDAVLGFKGMEMAVVAVREGLLPPAERLETLTAPRILVIAETEEAVMSLAPHLKVPARYITDQNLFQKPLHEAFYIYDAKDKVLRREFIPAFREEVPAAQGSAR